MFKKGGEIWWWVCWRVAPENVGAFTLFLVRAGRLWGISRASVKLSHLAHNMALKRRDTAKGLYDLHKKA